MNIKNLFLSIIVLIILFCCVTSFAQTSENIYEKSFDEGFTVSLPEGFTLVEVDAENQSTYFNMQKTYAFNGEFERLRVMVGSDLSVDEILAQDFSDSDQENLDLSIFTNKQLITQANQLNNFVGDHFPVYLTYKAPSSETYDSRLSILSTAYYIDGQKNVTGMVKAYQFYYLDHSIVFFYDTLIDGVYYNDDAFDSFDAIISSINFETSPTVKLKNPALSSQIFQASLRPLFVLFFGALFGYLFAELRKLFASLKKQNKDKQKGNSEDKNISELYEEINTDDDLLSDESPNTYKQHEAYKEAIDWNTLIDEVKSEKNDVPEIGARGVDQDVDFNRAEDVVGLTSIDDEVTSTHYMNDGKYDADYSEDLIFDDSRKIDAGITHVIDNEKERDDEYNTEISSSLSSDVIDQSSDIAKAPINDNGDLSKENNNNIEKTTDVQTKEVDVTINSPHVRNFMSYVDTLIAKKSKRSNAATEPELDVQKGTIDDVSVDKKVDTMKTSKNTTESDKNAMGENDKSHAQNKHAKGDALSSPQISSEESEPNEATDLNELIETFGDPDDTHEEYLNKILPKRKLDPISKGKKGSAPKIVLTDQSKLKLESASEHDLENLQKEIFSFLKKEQKSKKQQPKDTFQPPKENPIKMNRFSKFLNSLASRIERDDNYTPDEYAGVESRKELHRSEKVERNKIEDLIPGILDEDENDEVLDVIIDESLDVDHMKKNKDK